MLTPHPSVPDPYYDSVEVYPAITDGYTMLVTRDKVTAETVEIRMPTAWVTDDIHQRFLDFAREQRRLHGPPPLRLHR